MFPNADIEDVDEKSTTTNASTPVKISAPKENQVNLYNVILKIDQRTTFMIRNIPNKYTQVK